VKRPFVYVGLVVGLVVAVGIYLFITRQQAETYTVAVAGIVTATDSAAYTLEGHTQNLQVTFIASGAAQVGDVLLAGNGSPTWGYSARLVGGGCWRVRAESRVDGAWIDANIGDSGGRPGVDIHLRIPKSDTFTAGLGPNGQVLGVALCLDSNGRVFSAE
jgi:hypothetical protein